MDRRVTDGDRESFSPSLLRAIGVADHDVTLPSGEAVTNPLRIIPNAEGCDVIFTVHRRLGVSSAEFAADIDTVTSDLATLRESMEQA